MIKNLEIVLFRTLFAKKAWSLMLLVSGLSNSKKQITLSIMKDQQTNQLGNISREYLQIELCK